jgi:site-specific DNA-cytosine methylase
MSLCAFDPFAGVGGFGLGLAQGCAMKTCLGIEINPSAAETMRFVIICHAFPSFNLLFSFFVL